MHLHRPISANGGRPANPQSSVRVQPYPRARIVIAAAGEGPEAGHVPKRTGANKRHSVFARIPRFAALMQHRNWDIYIDVLVCGVARNHLENPLLTSRLTTARHASSPETFKATEPRASPPVSPSAPAYALGGHRRVGGAEPTSQFPTPSIFPYPRFVSAPPGFMTKPGSGPAMCWPGGLSGSMRSSVSALRRLRSRCSFPPCTHDMGKTEARPVPQPRNGR
jgi:hypothetical protein